MRFLRFLVNGQKIIKDPSCDFSSIIPGSCGYLYAMFSFSSDWIDKLKVAEFRKSDDGECYPEKIVNGQCKVPSEVLDGNLWCVNVIGKKGSTVIPTNKISVRQGG